MVWLYTGGVSLILPDVRFGTVSLDWVTNVLYPCTFLSCAQIVLIVVAQPNTLLQGLSEQPLVATFGDPDMTTSSIVCDKCCTY